MTVSPPKVLLDKAARDISGALLLDYVQLE